MNEIKKTMPTPISPVSLIEKLYVNNPGKMKYIDVLFSIYAYKVDREGYCVSEKMFPVGNGEYNKELAMHVRDVAQGSLIDIESVLSSAETAFLLKNYKDVVNWCYTLLIEDNPRHTHSFFVSTELRDFCWYLADFEKGSDIYCPFPALTDLQDCNYDKFNNFILEEPTGFMWALQCIVNDANGVNCSVSMGDTRENNTVYDNSFCIPPIGRFSPIMDMQTYVAEKLLDVNTKSKLVLVMPMSFCSSSSKKSKELREKILSTKHDVTIVSLPKVFEPLMGISTCAVYINKNGSGLIKLVDGTSFYNKEKSHRSKIHFQSHTLMKVISSFNEVYCTQITLEQYKETETLIPGVYLNMYKGYQKFEGEKLFKLSELVDFVRRPITGQKTIPYVINTDNLSFKYYDCLIKSDDIGKRDQRSGNGVVPNSMFVGLSLDKLKVGRIKELPDGNTICSVHIQCFTLKEHTKGVISEEYLLRTLTSEYIRQQVLARRTGAYSNVSMRDFNDIMIPVPSLEDQTLILDQELKTEITEGEKKLADAFKEYEEEMHLKKHSVAQTLSDLRNWFDVLMANVREANGVINTSENYSNYSSKTIGDVLLHIKKSLNRMSEKVESLAISEDYSDADYMDIFRYIRLLPQRNANPLFEVRLTEETSLFCDVTESFRREKNDKTMGTVMFSKKALDTIIDNIYSNAISYAFTGASGNIIEISLNFHNHGLALEISNNGKPLHPLMTEEKVFSISDSTQFGSNGHHGYGGYQIKKLMEMFKGEAHIISEPDSDFPVTYQLVFNNCHFGELIKFEDD